MTRHTSSSSSSISSSSNGTRGHVLGQSAVLYIATCLAIFFKFVGGFLVAGLLGPTLYGLRTVFGLVMEYEQYSHAGTFDDKKELPSS